MVKNLGKKTRYHVASKPQPPRREPTLYRIAQDIGRVKDMQGILALVFSVALTGAIIYTLVKATSTEAMTGIIQILVPIVTMIIGFYFGKKGREEATAG
jgi:drug/metabolite transporter (DMT)-like permease